MSDFTVRQSDETRTLIIEWNNRSIRKQTAATLFLPAFWILWTACVIWLTWSAFTEPNWPWQAMVFFPPVLVFGYVGVAAVPLMWMLRFAPERIEFNETEYRHYYIPYSWYCPVRWPLSTISSVELGWHRNSIGDIDAIATLNIRSGNKRDIVAYWADDDLKQRIYDEIAKHLPAISSSIELRNSMHEP